MPTIKQTESQIDGFTLKEYVYDSGLVEISFYLPELLKGAGPILRGMISKQPGRSSKWVGYTSSRNRVAVCRKKHQAIFLTLSEIKVDMVRDGSFNLKGSIC